MVAALAFEPVGHGWLAPLAMAMLWIGATRSHWRAALLHGACFGFTFMGVLLWWLVDSIGAGAWALLVGTQSVAVVAAAAGIHAVSRLPAGPVWAGAVWVLVESTRSAWPLGGLPWGRLGITAIDMPWVTLLPYVGIPGTGFVVASAGFALGGLATRHRGSDFVVVAAVVASFAATVAPFVAPHEGTFRIAVVQGGVPGDGRDVAGSHRQVTANHVQQTEELAQRIAAGRTRAPDLIVWPENSTAVDPVRDRATRAVIDEAVSAVGIPTLIGGIFEGPDDATAYNRGIVWLPDGETGPAYTKTHPVPFGEYIPWRSVIGGWSSRFQLIPRDFLPGSGEGPLDVAGVKVADAICFDVAYDDVLPDQVRRGAQLVTVQTSNATFYGTYQPEQQFEITRARAVELGRSVAVASTNGISAIIDPSGRVLVRSAEGSGAVAIKDVPLVDAITPAVRFQTHQMLMLSSLAIGGLLWCAARNSRWRRVNVGLASYRQVER
ncbi:apolipoprotein N-acyltransferase [Aeromicrobium sp. Sec7.5]|uniref:apolipoprotein N-acyltransferase n=1 Tax=Aeromicrobium sp. Sec7.5 TaxID=3121276 RepID=UPI002FE4F390